MYYKDLTLYSARHFENAFNIGWSEKCESDDKICDSRELINLLIPFLEYPLNTVRGGEAIKWEYNDHKYVLGFSEIRVISNTGIVYAAPNAILHYITANGYIPPKEFVHSLKNGISPLSDEYHSYIRNYGVQNFWGATAEQLEQKETIERIISSDDTALLVSSISNNPNILNVVTSFGSVLNYAICNKKEEMALIILEAGASVTNYNGIELLSSIKHSMYSVSSKLMDLSIPVQTESIGINALFVAIAYKYNDIAARLLLEKPELDRVYTNEYEKDLDLLKWCASCDNIEMFSFIRKHRGD